MSDPQINPSRTRVTNTKLWAVIAAGLVLLLLAYVAAGPYLAIRGIHSSLETRKLDRLERYVDFPALRDNVKGQVEDRLARAAGGADIDSGMFGGLAKQALGQISGHATDAMVSPAGIAILLEGRALMHSATGQAPDSGGDGKRNGYQPLKNATTRFESPSRFIATTQSAEGQPVTFLFERQGLRWRLTDIQLPPSR